MDDVTWNEFMSIMIVDMAETLSASCPVDRFGIAMKSLARFTNGVAQVIQFLYSSVFASIQCMITVFFLKISMIYQYPIADNWKYVIIVFLRFQFASEIYNETVSRGRGSLYSKFLTSSLIFGPPWLCTHFLEVDIKLYDKVRRNIQYPKSLLCFMCFYSFGLYVICNTRNKTRPLHTFVIVRNVDLSSKEMSAFSSTYHNAALKSVRGVTGGSNY